MNPGIYDNIPNAEYHGGEGVSNSMLKILREQSPLHLRYVRTAANDNVRVESPVFMLGTAFHALILEPELFVQDYTLGLRQSDFPEAIDGSDKLVALIEELNKGRLPKLSTTGTKDELAVRIIEAIPVEALTPEAVEGFKAASGKDLKDHIGTLNESRPGLLSVSGTIPVLAQRLRDAGMAITLWSDIKAEWMANNGHRKVLEPEVWDQLHRMREALMAHPAAAALFARKGKAEQSVYWVDKATGQLCRIRPDWWTDDELIVDLKSTEDASPEGFARSIDKFGYDQQDAFYQDGAAAAKRKARAFVFVAVEKSACVVDGKAKGVGVYLLDDASREIGRAKYRAALVQYSECERTGVWPCYGEKIQTISLPQWSLRKSEHLLEATS